MTRRWFFYFIGPKAAVEARLGPVQDIKVLSLSLSLCRLPACMHGRAVPTQLTSLGLHFVFLFSAGFL